MIKKCSRCGEEKGLSEFGKNKKQKDGFQTWCRSCQKEHYTQNKDEIAERMKEYQQMNKDKIAEQKKEYRTENKDKIAEQKKEYMKERYNNDHEFRLMCNIRRLVSLALKSKNLSKTSRTAQFADITAINEHLGPRPAGYHLDHIIPLSKFDISKLEHLKLAHLPQNLRYIPASENISKNDKIIPELIACSLVRQKIAREIGLDWKNLLEK